MAIQGLRATDDIIAQYQDRPENWRMGILMLDPNGSAPIYALTSMGKSESVDDPVFHWFEEERNAYRVALSADITNVATTIPVVSGASLFKEGDVLRVEQTEEIIIVTANPVSDTSLTVARGVGGSTATLVDFDGAGINPNLMLMGSANEEGSNAPEGRSYNPTENYNQTQIFRDTFEVTGTMRETEMRTGDQVKEDKRRCMEKHATGIERAILFGRRATTTKNGKPLRYMNGIIPQIPSDNVVVPTSGNYSLVELENYLRGLFTYGSYEKMCYCGNRFLLGVNQIVRKNGDYQLMPVSKEYGMNVRRLITPFGDLVLKTHPMFNQISSGITSATVYNALDTWGLIIDWKFLKYKYLRNRDTKYQNDLTEIGLDGLRAGYLTECAIELAHPRTFGLIKGLRAGVVDA